MAYSIMAGFILLLGIISSAAAGTMKYETLYSLLMSGTGLLIGGIGTAYTLRFGEFYADAFAAELLGKTVVSVELAKFARREKFIRYGLGFKITHPSFFERAQMLTETRVSVWSLAIGSAIVVCQVAFYLTLIPDALVPAMGSLLVPLIFGGIGIGIAVAAAALLSFWLLFILIAPLFYFCLQMFRDAPALVRRTWSVGFVSAVVILCGGLYFSGRIGDFSRTLQSAGENDVAESLAPIWFGVVAGATVSAILVSAILSKFNLTSMSTLRGRRTLVLSFCYLAAAAPILWALMLLESGEAAVIGGGVLLCLGLVGASQAKSAGLAVTARTSMNVIEETAMEPRLFGSDIGLLRFTERTALVLLFGVPAGMIAVEVMPTSNGGGAESLSACC